MKGYPKWFKAHIVHIIVGALFITGCFLIPTTLNARLAYNIEWRLNSDARIAMTFVHVLFGLITFILIGALWSIHMRYWWRREKARVSGATLVGIFILLGLTGLGILYSGAESLVTGTALAHTVVGLALIAPYIWHTIIRKRLED